MATRTPKAKTKAKAPTQTAAEPAARPLAQPTDIVSSAADNTTAPTARSPRTNGP